MPSSTTLALLCKSVDYGEADRVVTLLTDKLGKVAALARGARRSRKRFGAALGLFVLGEAALRPGRGRRAMPLLERFDAVENLSAPIGRDVAKMAHGSYILEVAREIWPTAQVDQPLFNLLLTTLRALGQAPAADPVLLRCFELRLLQVVGLAPSLFRCVSCGIDPQSAERYGFSASQGGVICPRCGPHGWPLDDGTLEALRLLVQLDPSEAASAPQPAAIRRELRDVTRMLLGHHLGKRLQSVDFIERLNSASR